MDKYENEIEAGMMEAYAQSEKDHVVSNVLGKIEGKLKTGAFEQIFQQTINEAIAKPKKNRWFDIFKSK